MNIGNIKSTKEKKSFDFNSVELNDKLFNDNNKISSFSSDDEDDFINGAYEVNLKLKKMEKPGNNYMAFGKNIGWRKLSGEIAFNANSSTELISKVTPINNTDISCDIYFVDNILGFKVSHHDAPGGETYIVKAISQTEFNKTSVHKV